MMEQTNGQMNFNALSRDNYIIYNVKDKSTLFLGKVIHIFSKKFKVNLVEINHKINNIYVCELEQDIVDFKTITDYKIISELEYLKRFSDNIKEYESKYNCNVIMDYEFEKIRNTIEYHLDNMECLGKFNEGDKKMYKIVYWSGGGEITQNSKCNRLYFKDKDEVEKEYKKLYDLKKDKLINNLEIKYMSFESYRNNMIRTFETSSYDDTFEVKTILDY